MAEALVDRVVRAALDARLEGRRDTILASLGDWSGRLPRVAIPRDQLESDVRRLAAAWPVDGRHPLSDWLASAAGIAREAGRPEAEHLSGLASEVERLPTSEPITSPPSESPYRAALAEHCKRLSSVGLPTPARRVDFDSLFVDMTVEVNGAGWLPITELLELLKPGETLVLVGDAGVGKTTTCRALIRAACARAATLPVWIRLRAWDPTMELLDWFEWHSPDVRLGREQVESALSAGRCVLFLDGFDEIARDTDRERLGAWMAAVGKKWPRAIMVVTTRPDVYDAELLSGTRVRLTYLSAAERSRLVERWCLAIYGEDGGEASAMAAFITDRLSASPALDAMVDTPLMVTLVVMVHMVHGDLPTERQRLVEQCVDTLLETWPATRGDENPVDDPDLSRAAIERLALYISFPEDDEPAFGGSLEKVQGLAGRALADEGIVGGRSLVRRWVEHLIRACGLFHCTHAGWVEFAHRVFADALVASAVDRVYAGHVERWILHHYDPLSDAAVELLLGRRREPAFYAGLSQGVLELLSDDFDRGIELLRTAARADADWSDKHRQAHFDAIYARLIEVVVDELDGQLSDSLGLIPANGWPGRLGVLGAWADDDGELREALKTRTRRTIEVGTGEVLLGSVAWGLRSNWVPDPGSTLSARDDGADTLVACARLWPVGFVGWAPAGGPDESTRQRFQLRLTAFQAEIARRLPTPAAIDRTDHLHDGDLLLLTVVALRDEDVGSALLAALSLRVAETALRLGCRASTSAQHLMRTPVPPLDGVGHFLAARAGEPSAMTRPRRPPLAPPGLRSGQGRSRHDMLRQAFHGQDGAARARMLLGPIEQHPPHITGSLFSALVDAPTDVKSVAALIPWAWVDMEVTAMALRGSMPGLPYQWPAGWHHQPLVPAPTSRLEKRGATLAPLAHAPGVEHRRLVPGLEVGGGGLPAYFRISRRWLLDAYIAGCHAEVLEPADRIGAYAHRLRGLNILEVWPLFDESLGLGARGEGGTVSAARHALYLALGWSSHTTTGQWPDSRLWSDLVTARPEDWLPRAHWHLCWLAHRPTDKRHRRGFLKSVQTGLRDPGLAPVAQRMAAWRPARGTTTW